MRRLTIADGLVVALLILTVVFGVAVRLQDPLSTRALAAEDPYTHVVFTKEWVDQGYFSDSVHLGTSMYPPGMHAWLGAFTPFTGFSLYEVARIAPAIFGGLAILGMFALGARLGGPVAGLAAAFLTAIVPEHIFRTEILFPTALDLALLPLWLLAFDHALRERSVAARVLFAGASVPLVVMHPWVVPLFALPLGIYAVLRKLRGDVTTRELAVASAMLVLPVAFAMSFRWDESNTGFSDFLGGFAGFVWLRGAALPGHIVFFGALAVVGVAAAIAVLATAPIRRLPLPVWLAVGGGLAAAIPWLARAPPAAVSYEIMLGMIALVLGLGGFALAFLRPSPLGDLGVSLCVVLFPLTAVNLFDNRYWPQRTVAYLVIGVVILGASLVAQAADLPLRFARSERARRVVAPTAIVTVALLLAGSASALTVNTYEWYRLYDEETFHGFEDVAALLESDKDAKVFIYTWQPALVVKTLAEPGHIWYSPKFFQLDPAKREEQLGKSLGPTYVLVDRFTRAAAEAGKADITFVLESKYRPVIQSAGGGLVVYEVAR